MKYWKLIICDLFLFPIKFTSDIFIIICFMIHLKILLFEKSFIAISAPFPYRKGYGAVGIGVFYFRYDIAYPVIIKIRVLAPLKNKGTKTEPIPLPAAFCYFLLRQAVSFGITVRPAYAAV